MSDDLERLIQAAEARANSAARWVHAAVDALARAALGKLWAFLVKHPGTSPRGAIHAAQVEFGGAFADALAEAFSELLQRSIGSAEVRAMPIGELTLSQRLYRHNVATAAEVEGAIREHAQGVHQAEKLARRLYDGYDPRDGLQRPLEGRARAELPRALRNITEDLGARRELTDVLLAAQQQAAGLKTPGLRAAYLEVFEAWKAGAAEDVLRQRLDMAMREKNRYFADRISQTELHRAHQASVARELMDDELTTVVQVRMNPAHPRTDICDLHATADLFGLGPGNYPKPLAPRPPFHPWCRCRLRPRPSLDAADARPAPGGAAAILRSMSPEQAAQVMGSQARAQRVLNGEPAESVINEGQAKAYRLARLGDERAQQHHLVNGSEFRQPAETFSPYDPGAPSQRPDTSTPARRAAVAIEDGIRRDTLETGAIIRPDGTTAVQRQGQPDRVRFTAAELGAAQGATFTHNHPAGAGPSVEDVAIASEFGFGELRVVTATLRHGLVGLPRLSQAEWATAYDDAQQRVAAQLRDEVRTGALHPRDFGHEARHRTWQALAAALKFNYWRERS